ncbi:MAG: tyrosine-type recombinase/integrase, partial [Pseudonocardiaceae bacterium]
MPPRRRRPRGHIRTLPSGSFQAIVYAGIDPLTGKERYLRETAATYDAAAVALTRLQGQVDEGRHPKSAITVGQTIAQWLDVAELEDTTRERYADLIRIYIEPTFGDLAASKLDAELLEKFYARLQRCRHLCNGRRPAAGHTCKPLASSTVRKVHFIISGALDRAVRWRHLGVNKAALAVAPSPGQTDPDPPTADEAAVILAEAWTIEPDWGLLLWLMMVTGLRRGEVSALRWQHLDFTRGLLLVQRSNAHPKSGVTEKETKTRQQRRVALDPQTMELLRAHRESCEKRCADLGCTLDADAWLFSPAPDCSAPWPPRALTQRYGRLASKLKLRSTRLHSLRHYSATELKMSGVASAASFGKIREPLLPATSPFGLDQGR